MSFHLVEDVARLQEKINKSGEAGCERKFVVCDDLVPYSELPEANRLWKIGTFVCVAAARVGKDLLSMKYKCLQTEGEVIVNMKQVREGLSVKITRNSKCKCHPDGVELLKDSFLHMVSLV